MPPKTRSNCSNDPTSHCQTDEPSGGDHARQPARVSISLISLLVSADPNTTSESGQAAPPDLQESLHKRARHASDKITALQRHCVWSPVSASRSESGLAAFAGSQGTEQRMSETGRYEPHADTCFQPFRPSRALVFA